MQLIYTHTTIQALYIYIYTPPQKKNRFKSRHIQQTKLKKLLLFFCRISQQKTSADLYTIHYIYILVTLAKPIEQEEKRKIKEKCS